MLKELLIAGLLGSTSSLTMQYQNNSKYDDFICNECKTSNIPETYLAYDYDFMNSFLPDYPTDVIYQFEIEYDRIYNSDDKQIENDSSYDFKHKFNELVHTLKKKVRHNLSLNRERSSKRIEPTWFRISHDGVLTFDKIN